MRITSDRGRFQGWYDPIQKEFHHDAAKMRLNSIAIERDTVIVLANVGCETINSMVMGPRGEIFRWDMKFRLFVKGAVVDGQELVCNV